MAAGVYLRLRSVRGDPMKAQWRNGLRVLVVMASLTAGDRGASACCGLGS
jgi:hypothetical protein